MAQPIFTETIGFLVSEATNDCLRLESLLQNTPKGTLIRGIIEHHAKDNEWDIAVLLGQYASHLYKQWEFRWKDKMDFAEYMHTQKYYMQKKHKLPDRLTDNIIERCEELQRNQSAIK